MGTLLPLPPKKKKSGGRGTPASLLFGPHIYCGQTAGWMKMPLGAEVGLGSVDEISSVLKATIENKTTSVTTHFKKLTTGNNVFIVTVIV